MTCRQVQIRKVDIHTDVLLVGDVETHDEPSVASRIRICNVTNQSMKGSVAGVEVKFHAHAFKDVRISDVVVPHVGHVYFRPRRPI
jgi:hypothetical protein